MQRGRAVASGWFATVGVVCILAGGLIAAATAHAPTHDGVWAVAYLVLVAGLAQVGLGAGQALLVPRTPSPRLVAVELLTWNLGNGAVIAGTLADLVVVAYVGGALLVAGLVLFVLGTRGSDQHWRLTRWAFRLAVSILAVSIPIGLVLATVRG